MTTIIRGIAVVLFAAALVAMVACGDDDEETTTGGDTAGASMEATESRLDTVKSRDKVICASRNDVPGYGFLDESGNNVGFDIDLCERLQPPCWVIEQDRDPSDHRRRARADHPVRARSTCLVRTVTWDDIP